MHYVMFAYMLSLSFLVFVYWSLFLSVICYVSIFFLYLLMKFMLNYTHEMHQNKWFIIVVYFVNVFYCANCISFNRFFKCFSLPFPSFMTMLIGIQSHGSEKHWWHNSMSMHGYILTSIKRSFLGTLFSYDSTHLSVI